MPGGRNAEASFCGAGAGIMVRNAGRRSNAAHVSTSSPEAKLYRNGPGHSRLVCLGHALAENRHGLVVDACLTHAQAMSTASPRWR